MVEKAVFLIDGAYLSFISKFIGKGKHIKFRIERFASNIARRIGIECDAIFYYTSPPYQSPNPSDEENKRKANYDRFIKKLKAINNPKITIREGRCQKIKDDYSQKGVDTLITMDLLKISQENKYKKIIFLTSDTDFVPIIQDISNKTGVILVYFTDRKRKSPFSLSNYLWKACLRRILIQKEDFI